MLLQPETARRITPEGAPVPLSYTIDPAAGVVAVGGTVPPTPEDIRRLFLAVLADPAYRPGLHFLFDRRPIPDVPSVVYIHQLVEVIRKLSDQIGPCKMAVLVPDPATYGMVRMGAALAFDTGVELGAFRDLDLATRWLAGDEDAIRR
jgi:hypothetical protein